MRVKANCSWGSAALLVSVLLLTTCANALYEDQIKKFDWYSKHIGALRQAHLDLNNLQPRLLVTTQENVLAALCPKTGELVWRQVLEQLPRGDMKLLYVNSGNGNDAVATRSSTLYFDVLTVQGHAPALVRGWNSQTGHMEFEWSLMPLQVERAEASFWLFANGVLYHVMPVWRSHLEVTQYFPANGQVVETTSKITTPWINGENCVLSGVYYGCLEGNQLMGIDLTATQPQVQRKTLPTVPKEKLQALEGMDGVFVVDKTLVSVVEGVKVCSNLRSNSFLVGTFDDRRVILQADVVNDVLEIRAHDADSCEAISELSHSVNYAKYYGTPTLKAFDCKTKRNNDGKGCLFLLGTADDAILAVQQKKIRWAREEALANVVASEFIDLPLADTEGTLESEMKGNAGDIVSAFLRRITTQVHQIKSIFLHVVGLGPPPTDTQKAGLVRDSFGLHKMLVVLTASGKLFGIDNINSKHHWRYYLPEVENFANGEPMRLVVQRTSKHFPLQPLCTVVARHTRTGNGVLHRFNPINGNPAEGGHLELNYKIKQMSLLSETETDSIKGLLVVDANNKLEVFPDYTKDMAVGMYIFTADKKTSVLDGFNVRKDNDQLSLLPIWNARLDGFSGDHQIIAVAAKNPLEHVHSQGRVLGDRSVLYKYINPNLVAVITQANDNIHKYLLNVFLIDVVSGSIIFSMTHRRARAPVHVVHSENWLAYTYYNDKVRRTEITTVELYEGKTQANSTVWSSLNAPPLPMVERQSYIIPTVVETMRETITERGITNKHVLIATASGAIVEMPWALLDPRRPILSSTQGREEGAIPYMPELPLPTENIINYNQTIARIRNIHTAPSGLESTCLVLATGLDMFVTRVAPSKTFDLLKEDFDYMLITIVLIVLTTGSLVVKHLASRKLLKQAWK